MTKLTTYKAFNSKPRNTLLRHAKIMLIAIAFGTLAGWVALLILSALTSGCAPC